VIIKLRLGKHRTQVINVWSKRRNKCGSLHGTHTT